MSNLIDSLSRNLRGYWCPMLQYGGLVLRDQTRFKNHGTLTNFDATIGNDWIMSRVKGRSGRVLDFDGTNDRIDIPGSYRQSIPITFSAWVMRTADWAFSGNCLFWAKPNAAFNGNGFYIEPSSTPFSNNTLVVVNGAATNYLRLNQAGNTSFPLNTWTHFAFTISSSTAGQFYLNGQAVSTSIAGSLSITGTSDTKYILNNSPGYGNYTPGRIAEVSIWNRALTPGEIQELYRICPGWYQPQLPRRIPYSEQQAGFKAYWARQQSQLIGGGV